VASLRRGTDFVALEVPRRATHEKARLEFDEKALKSQLHEIQALPRKDDVGIEHTWRSDFVQNELAGSPQ
jgi:hypothetical protein